MSEGFKQFDELSKGLYGVIIATDIAFINGLLGRIKESKSLVGSAILNMSFGMFLTSIFIIILGILIGSYHSKEEGFSSNGKKPRDINRTMFKWLYCSAFFSLLGLASLCCLLLPFAA